MNKNKDDGLVNVIVGVLAVLGFVALVTLFWGIRSLIVWLAWNLGVVNIAQALGEQVGTIEFFWTSVGVAAVWTVLASIFNRRTEVKS